MTYTGGCACGAIRYAATSDPTDAGYCHCRLCQRSTGAPVLAWASYPVNRFSYTQGQPEQYATSAHGHREFCRRCGTQIAYRDSNGARTVEINVGSLDDCESIRPRYHIWCKSRIPWFDVADDLPRFPGPKPDVTDDCQ